MPRKGQSSFLNRIYLDPTASPNVCLEMGPGSDISTCPPVKGLSPPALHRALVLTGEGRQPLQSLVNFRDGLAGLTLGLIPHNKAIEIVFVKGGEWKWVLTSSVHADDGSHLISILYLSLWARLVAYSSLDIRTWLLLILGRERGRDLGVLSLHRGAFLPLGLSVSMDPVTGRRVS